MIDGVNGSTAERRERRQVRSTCTSARANPEPGKKQALLRQPVGHRLHDQRHGNAYVVSAGSDLLVKVNVAANGKLTFTVDADTTRYIDLNDPANPATSGANAGKNPQGIVINRAGHARLRDQLRLAQRLASST